LRLDCSAPIALLTEHDVDAFVGHARVDARACAIMPPPITTAAAASRNARVTFHRNQARGVVDILERNRELVGLARAACWFVSP
jgi:hypothetical protein